MAGKCFFGGVSQFIVSGNFLELKLFKTVVVLLKMKKKTKETKKNKYILFSFPKNIYYSIKFEKLFIYFYEK